MWRRYFKLKLVPGVVITQKFGRIDFKNEKIDIEILRELYEDDFPYLELTEYGKHRLYGIEPSPAPQPVEVVQHRTEETVTSRRTRKQM